MFEDDRAKSSWGQGSSGIRQGINDLLLFFIIVIIILVIVVIIIIIIIIKVPSLLLHLNLLLWWRPSTLINFYNCNTNIYGWDNKVRENRELWKRDYTNSQAPF